MEDNKNYRFVFVVLHYNTINDTIECVDSILNNVNWPNFEIVIVDNGSPNNSGIKLEKKYAKDRKVHVLISKQNLGFAKGNNLGYSYAKYQLNAHFIILINNDTLLTQKEFIAKIAEKYEQSAFHILGPDIISLKNNSHQNPVVNNLLHEKEIKRYITKLRILILINLLRLESPVRTLKRFLFQRKKTQQIKQYKPEEVENVKLHGSCLVFSPKYVKLYEGLYEKTFMYLEEDILYYIAQRDNLKTVFYPEIYIYHKEDSSTDATYKKERSKRLFIYLNALKSAKAFLKLIEYDKKEF